MPASFAPGQIPGLAAAFVAAFVWAAYSVMSRKLKAVPTDAVAGFCLATALLAALVHGMVETTVWPETIGQWLAIIALGVGPVGAAFFVWDIGMKRGDIRVLGAASYATPLLSTAFLILAGFAQPTATIAIAAVLIAGGGLIAAKDMVWKRKKYVTPSSRAERLRAPRVRDTWRASKEGSRDVPAAIPWRPSQGDVTAGITVESGRQRHRRGGQSEACPPCAKRHV